jgi:two-component system NarL family sensor kinase
MSSRRKLVLLTAIPLVAALLALALGVEQLRRESACTALSAAADASARPGGGMIKDPLLRVAFIGAFAIVLLGGCMLALSLREHRLAYRKLQRMTRRVVEVQERERKRWSRELHDGTGQVLVSVKLLVESAVQEIDSDPEQATERLLRALERIADVSAEVRRISHTLRPQALDSLGLAAALQQLAVTFSADTGLACGMTVSGERRRPIPGDVATAFYRVAQEALANVRKHANAAGVDVELALRPDGIRMIIVDDGDGFDVAAVVSSAASGIGLRNLRERLASVGGWFEIHSRPGRTSLTASWNRDHEHAAADT